jgi:hypothetical protein
MTIENTIDSKSKALGILTDLYWSYEELRSLLPDDTCHRLLGLINKEFEKSLPQLLELIDQTDLPVDPPV